MCFSLSLNQTGFGQVIKERINILGFEIGSYDNSIASNSNVQRMIYPDLQREQPFNFISNSNHVFTLINGQISGKNGFIIVTQDIQGSPISVDFYSIPNAEIVINSAIQHNDSIFITGSINEFELLTICLDSQLNIIWSRRAFVQNRMFQPESIDIFGNYVLVISSENLGFYLANTSGNPDVTNGYTTFTLLNSNDGTLVNHLRIKDAFRPLASRITLPASLSYRFTSFRLGRLKTVVHNNAIYICARNHTNTISGIKYSHIVYKLDSSLNVIWADSISNEIITGASNDFIYTTDFFIDKNDNLNLEFMKNSFAGSSSLWKLQINDQGNQIGQIFNTNFSHPSGAFDPNNQNHVPLTKTIINNSQQELEFYGSMHYVNNFYAGNAILLKNNSNVIYDKAYLNNNNSFLDYENQRFIGLTRDSGYNYLESVTLHNDSIKILQAIDIYKFDSIEFNNWNCDNTNFNISFSQNSSNGIISKNFPLSISNQIISFNNLNLKKEKVSATGTILCPGFDTCQNIKISIQSVPDTICKGSSLQLKTISRLIDKIIWIKNGISIDTAFELQHIFLDTGIVTIKVIAFPIQQGCAAMDSINIYVRPSIEFGFFDTTICKGDTLQIQASGATTYQWDFSNQLSCLNCPNPVVSSIDSTYFVLTGIDSFGCSSTDTFFLNVYPKPNATISGSNTVCPGVNDVWFGLNPLDSFIATWWIDTVGIITQDFGDSIYTTWPLGIDSAFVYAYVQYPAGCDGDTIRFKVKVNQALEPKIVLNEDSICFSDRENVIYNLTYNTNGSIYLWEIENGQILSGDSTSSIVVNWDSVGIGKLIVREYSTTSIDTCFGADSVEIEILPNPENDLMLTGKEDVCLNEDVNYELTSGWPNSTYEWIASGSVILSGQGTENIQTSWNSIGDYVLSAQEVSEYGCRGPKDSLEVRVHPIPEPQRVGEDTLLCLDELGSQNYEVSGFVNSAFNWSIEGGMIKSGQGTNSINVTWDSTIIKSLTVQEISEFGCESETLDIKQYFDLSRLELFVVSVSEDSSISLDFELESLRSYPGDSIWIARRTEVGDPGSGPGMVGNWARIIRIPKTSTDFEDQSINPNQSSYGYRVEGLNSCEQEIMSRDHGSVFLQGNRQIESQSENELVKLNWTAYRNWDEGVKSYELYEKFDSTYVKVAEANQTEIIFNPKIPKKEHCFRIRAVQNVEERESWSNAFCIELERALNIPNVVTPNGDNKNDRLQIKNLAAYPDHELTIYNRWGQEIFNTTDYNNNWPENSTISGTYFYRLRIEDNERNISDDYKGWIQVLR